jgi:hypothetical protein
MSWKAEKATAMAKVIVAPMPTPQPGGRPSSISSSGARVAVFVSGVGVITFADPPLS